MAGEGGLPLAVLVGPLDHTWPERQSRVGFTREELVTVVRAVGKGNKIREETLTFDEALLPWSHVGPVVQRERLARFAGVQGVHRVLREHRRCKDIPTVESGRGGPAA